MEPKIFKLEINGQGQKVLTYDARPIKKFAITVVGVEGTHGGSIIVGEECETQDHLLALIEKMKEELDEISEEVNRVTRSD